MTFRTFIDDSSDEQQEKVVVAGAYFGSYDQWSSLGKKWKARLKRDGLAYFRSTEYYSLSNEFYRYRDPVKYPKPEGSKAAKALRNSLDTIIHKSDILGIAVCVPVQMYNEVRKREQHAAVIFPKDHYEVALQGLWKYCAEIARDEFSGSKVAFICDDGPSSARIAKEYAEFKILNPDVAGYMKALIHQDDKAYPGLQAADLMAHLGRESFTKWADDPDGPLPVERLQHVNVYHILAFRREYILTILGNERKRRGL